MMETIRRSELDIKVCQCADGDIEVTLDDNDSITGIKATPVELRRICLMILEACNKVDACHYTNYIGHA